MASDTGSQPLFTQRAIEGKGYGIIATTDIQKHAIILKEKPIITRPSLSLSMDSAYENKQIQNQLHSQPEEKQRAYLGLHRAKCRDGFSKLPFLDIYTTNAFGLGESSMSGVFELCSRFNHSCKPNAEFAWNVATESEEVHAIRDIMAGEEILVSYLGFGGFRKAHLERQKFLKEAYGFHCKCEACSLSEEELRQSDHRRVQLAEMDTYIGNGVLVMVNPSRALGMCKKSLEYLKIEGMEPENSRVLHDAFQICLMHGDLARASAFATLNAMEKELTAKEPEETRKLHMTAKNLASHHPLYCILGSKWKTSLTQRKDPGSKGFQQWLWLRAQQIS